MVERGEIERFDGLAPTLFCGAVKSARAGAWQSSSPKHGSTPTVGECAKPAG